MAAKGDDGNQLPSLATEAVLVTSSEMEAGSEEVQGYDFNKGMYGVINDGLKGGFKIPKEALPERQMNAEAIVSRITQR